ncbi:MAG: hypothetical protein MK052_09840 [Alphaproteobacteria bacterium]|nr:hypothetical protein [Alphaproteobacteria bacterium]
MPQNIFQKTGNQAAHVTQRIKMGIRTGARVGAIAGAAIGVGALFVTANVMTMGSANLLVGMASFALAGSVGGAIGGMSLGGVAGAVRGLLTRPKPNGDQITDNALECGKDAEQPAPPEKQKGAAPTVAQTRANATQPKQRASGLSQEAMDEVTNLTRQMNQSHVGNVPAQAAAPAQESWQARTTDAQRKAGNSADMTRV